MTMAKRPLPTMTPLLEAPLPTWTWTGVDVGAVPLETGTEARVVFAGGATPPVAPAVVVPAGTAGGVPMTRAGPAGAVVAPALPEAGAGVAVENAT